MDVYAEVKKERLMQDLKWGGSNRQRFYNSHNWIVSIINQLGAAAKTPFDIDNFRRQMVKAAALAIAAYESSLEWESRPTSEESVADVEESSSDKSVPMIIVERSIADEPELPGTMPDDIWEVISNDKDAATELLREAVRMTKLGILRRVKFYSQEDTEKE